jgi:serine/threonine protein kinase
MNTKKRQPSPQNVLSNFSTCIFVVAAVSFVFVQFTTLERFERDRQVHAIKTEQAASLPLVQSIYDRRGDEEDEHGTCTPSQPWQTQTFLACNRMHEISSSFLKNVELINCGGSRCAFRLVDDGGGDYIVLKTMKFSREVTTTRYHKARIDTMAMERLTSSPYVASVYGNCGGSQLVELADQNLHDLFKRRRQGSVELTSKQQLKIAFQLASAVADLHSFDNENEPSVAHLDICCHQFVLIQGVYKLNDFHMSVFLQYDSNSTRANTTCPIHAAWDIGLAKLHAPEEQQIPSDDDEGGDWPDIRNAPAIDVYMLGNVLYTLLTSMWVFEGSSAMNAIKTMQSGSRAPSMKTSEDAAIRAVQHAMSECWKGVMDRPSASTIRNYLKEELSKLEGRTLPTPVKVLIPPLPRDHRYTDTDFYSNLGEH